MKFQGVYDSIRCLMHFVSISKRFHQTFRFYQTSFHVFTKGVQLSCETKTLPGFGEIWWLQGTFVKFESKKFLRFKLYKRILQTSNFYKSWQAKLLIHEIKIKKKIFSLHISNQLPTKIMWPISSSDKTTPESWLSLSCNQSWMVWFYVQTEIPCQKL